MRPHINAALDSGTVAVLAGGLDRIYPPENEALHHKIGEVGCLISDRPPGFKPRGQDFPRRNRIISGISMALVVVEAAERSGSLITARMAGEQGRHVYAVPGHPLDPRAKGTNGLIRMGATMATSAEDILEDIAPAFSACAVSAAASDALSNETDGAEPPTPDSFKEMPPPLPVSITTSVRERVEKALSAAPVELDEICRSTGLAVRNVQIALLEISLAGRLEHHGSGLVSLRY